MGKIRRVGTTIMSRDRRFEELAVTSDEGTNWNRTPSEVEQKMMEQEMMAEHSQRNAAMNPNSGSNIR